MLKSSESLRGGTCWGWQRHADVCTGGLFSRETFYYSGRKEKNNIKTKSSADTRLRWTNNHQEQVSFDGQSCQHDGCMWAKWIKHSGGGWKVDMVRLWNLWLCFHRLAAMLICKCNGRYSRLDTIVLLHLQLCISTSVTQSKQSLLFLSKNDGIRNVAPTRPQNCVFHFFFYLPWARSSLHCVNLTLVTSPRKTFSSHYGFISCFRTQSKIKSTIPGGACKLRAKHLTKDYY